MGRKLGKLPSQELKNLMGSYKSDSLESLASAMGLPYETVRNWHTRESVPEKYVLRAQMNDKKFTNEHILVNRVVSAPAHLPYPKHQPAEPLQVRENTPAPWGAEPVAVPVYKDVKASAGDGAGVQSGEVTEVHLLFSPVYMRRHFGRSGEGFAMIYVKGDSMQPSLLDGDEIVIDTRQRRVDRDGIYVITLRGDLKVKRIQQRLDGSLAVKSDNPAYEAESIGAAQAEDFLVEGRLVWPRLR